MPELDAAAESDLKHTPGAAHYIATLTEELAQLARRHNLDTLSFILDMARLEAEQVERGSARPGGLAS